MKRAYMICILFCGFVIFAGLMGCGRKGAEDGAAAQGKAAKGKVKKGARLIIQTGGYLPGAPMFFRKWANGGLAALGDINSDGYTDLIVGSGAYPGSFAAFSGKNGKELWRVKAKTGSAAKKDNEKGYTFNDFSVIPDRNGDSIPDVFIRNDWTKREAFIFSGKDGSRLLRKSTGRMTHPSRIYDIDGDGTADLVSLRPYKFTVTAISTADMSETLNRESVLGLDTAKVKQTWIVPSWPDINRDGIDEYLVGVREKTESQWLFVSGKDFSVMGRVPVTRELASGLPKLYCAGDLNGDGTTDLFATKNIGARANKEFSYLGALSGKDGSELWQIDGGSLPGGMKRIRVNVKTGERRELPGDVGFGDRPEILVDLDGDGAREIACSLPIIVGEKRTRGVLIFSGATGKHLVTLTLPSRKGRLFGSQMLLIEKFGPKGRPVLAVSGMASKNKYIVAIFNLPKIKN